MTWTPTHGVQEESPAADDASQRVLLSVVIAAYNAQETIAAQLEALAAQPAPVGWEVLVCDNGSTDGTLDVVRRYAGRLPMAVVDATAQRGPGAARNIGAAHARGRWLAFCDADDVVGAGWVEAMATALAEHPFVAGRFEAHLLNTRRMLASRSLDQQEGLQHSPTGPGLPHAGAGNMGIHRELFLGLGGFDPTVLCLEDTDLSWRVQRTGVDLTYVPDAVVHVRLRSSLPQMFRQGKDYGDAHALLERRYSVDGVRIGDDGTLTKVVASTGGRGLGAVTKAWLGPRPSLSRIVWQLGWHSGYRAGRRAEHLSPARAASADV